MKELNIFYIISSFMIRDHAFVTFTWQGVEGVFKFVTCLRILLFLDNRSDIRFCGWWGSGVQGSKKKDFCGRHE